MSQQEAGMKRIIIAGSLAVLLSGCAHWDLHQQAQEKRYLSQPIEAMYDEYGAPVGIAPLKSGGKFVEFVGYRGGYRCEAAVKTNAEGTIISISTSGQNGCITGRY
jgi:hypothetical protein